MVEKNWLSEQSRTILVAMQEQHGFTGACKVALPL